ENAERQRKTAEHLHHAEVAGDILLRARRAVLLDPAYDLGAHGVRDDILEDDARDDDELGRYVDRVWMDRGKSACGSAGQQQEPRGDETGTEEHVDTAL